MKLNRALTVFCLVFPTTTITGRRLGHHHHHDDSNKNEADNSLDMSNEHGEGFVGPVDMEQPKATPPVAQENIADPQDIPDKHHEEGFVGPIDIEEPKPTTPTAAQDTPVELEKRKEKHKLHDSQDESSTTHTMDTQPSPESQAQETSCGSFLIRQSDGFVYYDDFEQFDLTEGGKNGIICHEGSSAGREFCMATKDDDAALLVQGKCKRGVGTTKVSFVVAENEGAHLLFACKASAQATPSVRCKCQHIMDKDKKDTPCDGSTDLPFLAEARFGNLTIPTHTSGECTLRCKMPTTDE